MGRRGFSTNTTESCLHHLLSGLPPTNFSIQQHIFHMKPHLWPKIHTPNVPPTTKSWIPSPPRCAAAPRPPQLRHVTAAPPQNPRPDHFLADPGSILETALERGDLSYWSLLEEYSDAKKGVHVAPSQPSDDLHRKLRLDCVHTVRDRDAPCSGITVTYSVARDPDDSCSFVWSPIWKHNRPLTVRYECAVSDPFDARRKPMEFATVIGFGGRFYGVSLQGAVASMEVIGARLRITGVGSTRGVPVSRSRMFKEYLVEMKEEILLVFVIHCESVEVVDGVEVFRLDFERLDWVKVERLQGKTMFLKERGCEWVESAEFGCRDNCVFFTEGKENKWKVYDLKKCCISSV